MYIKIILAKVKRIRFYIDLQIYNLVQKVILPFIEKKKVVLQLYTSGQNCFAMLQTKANY